jgi:hypothetical protein
MLFTKRTQLCCKPYTAWLIAIFLIIEDFEKKIWGGTELNQQSFGPIKYKSATR